MSTHEEDARAISEAFEMILYACEEIKSYHACHGCPLKNLCIDDPEVSVLDVGDLIGKDYWRDFLEYAYDEATWSEEDRYAQHIDNLRDLKMDEEIERWFNENDG